MTRRPAIQLLADSVQTTHKAPPAFGPVPQFLLPGKDFDDHLDDDSVLYNKDGWGRNHSLHGLYKDIY